MNFTNSTETKKIIANSKNILMALHQSPDPDSIVSNVLMSRYLKSIGKKHKVICLEKVHEKFRKSYPFNEIEDGLDVKDVNFDDYDLFIALDVNTFERFGFPKDISFKNVINIDHHFTENSVDGLKIIDTTYSSASEMVFYLLEDFGYKLNSEEAGYALMGIVTDSDSFSYSYNSRVFRTVSKLIDLGGNYDRVNEIVYRNNSYSQIKFWGDVLGRVKVDTKNKFTYVSIPLKITKKYPDILQGTRTVADKFIRTIENTNFGLVMTETEEGYLKISVRSKESNFGVPELLRRLNGGGHFTGGGGRMDLPFEAAVKETLKITRRFAKEFPNGSK